MSETPSRGSTFDDIRFSRDFSSHERRIAALEAASGDPLAGGTFPVAVFRTALTAEGSTLAADTDGTHDTGLTLTIPQATLRIGGRMDVKLLMTCEVNAYPWTFQITLHDGTNAHPVHDAIAPTDPGDPNTTILAEFTASFWLNGTSLELAAMGKVTYHAPVGVTDPLGGVGLLSDLTPVLCSLNADLNLTPQLIVSGAAVGNTFTLRRYEIVVYDQFS